MGVQQKEKRGRRTGSKSDRDAGNSDEERRGEERCGERDRRGWRRWGVGRARLHLINLNPN